MKQTAIEFAVNKLANLIPSGNQILIRAILIEAKQMDKQQKKKAFEKGYECGVGDYIDCENGFDCKSIGFEEYYNTEYGGEK